MKIIAALKDQNLLCGRFACDSFALHSQAGCKKQPWHTDYDCDAVKASSIEPLSAVLALQNNTLLCFKDQTIELQTGDMCVFSGDEVHAGAAYATENTRIFMYISTALIETPVNLTYPFKQKLQSNSKRRAFVLSSRVTPIVTRSISQRTHSTSYEGIDTLIAPARTAAPSTPLTPALPTHVAVESPTHVAIKPSTHVAVESPTHVAVATPTPLAVSSPTTVVVESPTPLAVVSPATVAVELPT